MARGKRDAAAPKRGRKASKNGKDEIAAIDPKEAERLKGKAKQDLGALPRFTVTIRGSLPKVMTGVILKKGPIPAQSREAAIARFTSELGTQLKKAELLDVEAVEVAEASGPAEPTLPFEKKGEKAEANAAA